MSRITIETYNGAEVFFDTEGAHFVSLPPGCTKERKCDTMWQMRMEVDAAVKRQNQPKRKRTRHAFWWWDESTGKAKHETFVGIRAPEKGQRGVCFKDDGGHTHYRSGDWRETKIRVIPMDMGPDEIRKLEYLHEAAFKAKRAYEIFLTGNTRPALVPSVGWNWDVEELNKRDERFVEHLTELAKPRSAQ